MKLSEYISSPKAIFSLSVYRIGLGIFMLLHFFPLFKRISNYHISDQVLYFPHQGFDWLPLLNKPIMFGIVLVAVLAAGLFTVGIRMKWSGFVVSTIYFYFILLDKFYWNNHYYLLALMVFLCSFTVADRSLSFKKNKISYKTLVHGDHYLILQLMLGIVFFYGGLAKLNTYWMSGDIASEILSATPFGNGALMVAVLTWGGLFFDLGIAFLLFIKRTRWVGFGLALAFNITNAIIFNDISYFPYFMLFSLILFFPGLSFYEELTKPKGKEKIISLNNSLFKGTTGVILMGFFVFQLLFPLRHHFISGFVEWTGQGHYFSWRMKSFTKDVSLQLYLVDKGNPVSKQKLNVGLDNYTLQRAAVMPDMVLTIASYVAKNLEQQGDGNFAILCDYDVNLNSKGSQSAIDPTQDLLQASYSMKGDNNWIFSWKPKKE